MPPPSQILRYFSELAPVGRGPRWNHAPAEGDIVSVPWPWKVVADDDGTFVVEGKTTHLWRLWSAARINGSRDFLRMGWLFVSGTVDIGGKKTKVFLPLASAPVRLRRSDTSKPASPGSSEYEIVADSDLAVPESVFSDHRVRESLNEELEKLIEGAFPLDASVMSWELVKGFVERFCREAGLPTPTVVAKTTMPVHPTDGELTVHTGLAVYTSRDRSAINLESTLQEWADQKLARTALASIYGNRADRSQPDVDHIVASSLPLNRNQERAVLAARQLPVTVLSGPPGTGKTHTAVAIAIDQIARGKSVLIAAQSDDAVDAVEALLNRYSSPRHVRFGSRSSRKRVAVELSDGLVAAPGSSLQQTVGELEAMEEKLEQIDKSVRRRLEIEQEFSRALEVRRRNAWCLADAPGLSDVLRDPALAEDLARLIARKEGGGIFSGLRRRAAVRRIGAMLRILPESIEPLREAVIELIDAERSIRAGQASASQSIARVFEDLDRTAIEMRQLFGDHVEALRSGRSWDPGATRSIGLLATALRSGQAARRRALRTIEMGAALKALPLWLGTISDIDDVLPIRPAMFDVVIVDESSQVNQVRAATSLARGISAVVIGDPRQLRHVSFVGDQAMASAAGEVGLQSSPLLDIRRNSLFDVAAGATPVMQLTEHYRSSRHLIDFSNRRFYEGRLQLMTEHPATSSEDVIHVERVDGERDGKGVVRAELETVFRLVDRAKSAGSQSVGVVTPFRAQADAIAGEAQKRLTPDELDALDLRVATVHGFQGNERDKVIVSLGLGPGDVRSMRFVEDPNLFNVMVTRARNDLTVLLSMDPDTLPDGLLLDYIRHAGQAPVGPRPATDDGGSGWKSAVLAALQPYGLPLWLDYPVGGYTVDIAAGEGNGAIGVECTVHQSGVAAHMERHIALRGAGWELMTAMESRWLSRPEDAAEAIAQRVMRRRSIADSTQ
ncbi:MAG: AAA family ATPase [Acidimicrobiia bacterium]|nr:AAA family ATPase [Acidimicrobiia bacterium]